MAKRQKRTGPVPVESIKHKDTRTNIPTQELRGFVAVEEARPPAVLYPRDPSLDPQLVWKGKDEQDAKPLEVPAVPIYIQEKIHPQALVELLRDTAKTGEREPELTLFDDFNGVTDFELKRALRAEIDEGTWSTLYSTRSRPFAAPDQGRIAVKEINHYGDEVLRVFEV